jgi:hypothetical protein
MTILFIDPVGFEGVQKKLNPKDKRRRKKEERKRYVCHARRAKTAQ